MCIIFMRKNYSLEQVKEIMINYNLGEPRVFSIFEIGLENTNILVETKQGKYVIKVCEVETVEIENIEFEISLMMKAFGCGLPVPKVIKSKTNNLFITFSDKIVFVMSYLEGENIQNKQVTISFLEEVAQASANMLKCFADMHPVGSEHEEHYWNLKTFDVGKKYLSYLKKDNNVDQALIKTIYNEWEDNIAVNFPKMQMSYIHNDIASHNLLMKDGHLSGIVDFGDAVYGYLAFELAVTITQLCMLQEDWKESIRAYVKKFQELLPLNDVEKDIMYYLVRSRSANMVVICNGLYYSESKREDYLWFYNWGVENLKKLEEIGKDEFDKLL